MSRVSPVIAGLLFLTAATVGCRGPEIRLAPPRPATAIPAPTEPATVAATPIELDYKTLPRIEPGSDAGGVRPPPRGITESEVARVAAERALTANLLQTETGVPRAVLTNHKGVPLATGDDKLIVQVRTLAATEARNRTASDALISYFQLADAEGRGNVLRNSVILMDQLKAAVKDAKDRGAKVPVETDELDRQRAGILALLGQADLGAKLLDVDLKRRLGLPGSSAMRLQPTGDFGMSFTVPVESEAIERAVSQRADLQALRTVYLGISNESLPLVRDYLRTLPGLNGLIGSSQPQLPLVRRFSERRLAASVAALDTVLDAELAVRRKQLWNVIEEKERGVADEVRVALAAMNEQSRQVGLARWRAEQLIAKVEDEKKQARGVIFEQLAEIESLRARADVIAAVMQWHQARVRVNAALGLYAAESGR